MVNVEEPSPTWSNNKRLADVVHDNVKTFFSLPPPRRVDSAYALVENSREQ